MKREKGQVCQVDKPVDTLAAVKTRDEYLNLKRIEPKVRALVEGGRTMGESGERVRRTKRLREAESNVSHQDEKGDKYRKVDSTISDSFQRYATRSQNASKSSSRRVSHSKDERKRRPVVKTSGNSTFTASTSTSYREAAPDPVSTSSKSHPYLRSKISPPEREDDQDGHYIYKVGENFTKRYKIFSSLGEGTFGKVIECWDRVRKKYVAIKIIRNVPKYHIAGMIELSVLNTIRKQRSHYPGGRHCVDFIEWFNYRGHICIVFSKLGLSLFDLLRKNSYRPFDLFHVQRFSKQLLETVMFLHEIRLVHTDLKPENILLPTFNYIKPPLSKGSRRGKRVPEKSDIYLIDYGSATFEDMHHSKVVSTRHYRAPEVVLGLSWSFPCDIWSVGCIIVELVTGEALFKTHDNLEHLAMMQKVLGDIPKNMVKNLSSSSQARKYFHEKDGTLTWPQSCKLIDSVQAVNALEDLKSLISNKCDISVKPAIEKLVELLKALLSFDPKQRISAKDALNCSFFGIETK